ncbi:DUF4170 domain-containing protein [Aestuariispira insulae]|uniref:Uncharacterized protein DUF4170 n=1 Tax=Aestuariispira insulae TaxID=1461337 RepID=A0A3D9HGJ4_9PROT|nr:DUF4170 domain-containing protein [Aestuariispira insulae]RED48622.1 uncharacterized protein DUF4170 [Aestuariispira insulae]
MTETNEQYYVVGGLFKDTTFTDIAEGEKLLKLGPFDNYDEALAVWRAKAMETVDEAYAKFNIEKVDHKKFWVVGGEYTDTDFKTIKGGGDEDHIGPFDTREEARDAWKSKSMASVDNCYVRYRIDKL